MTDDVQTALTSHRGREIVEMRERDSLTDGVHCPDCGQDITATKGSHPAPESTPAGHIWGWRCAACENICPSGCMTADARTFNDQMTGVRATYRNGTETWVPVVASTVEDGDSDD